MRTAWARQWLASCLLGLVAGATPTVADAGTLFQQPAAPETPPQQEEVILLDAGHPIDSATVVATRAGLLRSGGFRPEVIAEVQSRYFGYMIDRRQNDGRWEYTGAAKAFTARYGASTTTGWPDRTAFIYQDSRTNAAALTRLDAAQPGPESANLRIYGRPSRVGYRDGRYVTEDTLLMFYLEPQSGRQSAFLYRKHGENYELYHFPHAPVPGQPTAASTVFHMAVATTDTISIRVFIANISVAVPRHTYPRSVFRVVRGYNYDGTDTPMGPPIRFTGISLEAARAPFDAVLAAYRAGTGLTNEQFHDVFRFVRQVHQYKVELPAGATPK